MIVIEVIISIIQITTAFFTIYVLILGFAAFFPARRKQKMSRSSISTLRSFAILIPAKDEERVIGETIKSLKKLNYPPDLIDIYVVADNCTDCTVGIARESGALVYERTRQSQSWAKPRALKFLLERLEDEHQTYDVYVVLDADNIADPQFCSELNKTFDHGFHAVQGHRQFYNSDDNWLTNLIGVSEMAMLTELAGRERLGLSSCLRGSAMGFTADLLNRIGGIPQYADETSALQAMCALHGFRVGWCPSAVVFDENVSSYQELSHQRWRWFWVITHTIAPLGLQLLRNILHSPTLQKIEQLVYLFRYQIPNSILIACLLMLLGASVMFPGWVWPWWVWGGLLVGYGTYFLVVLSHNKASFKTYLSLSLAPLFVLIYGWILISVLLGKRGARGKTQHRGKSVDV